MHRLHDHLEALTLCAYCPSLCRHSCPVAGAENRDTVTPWGLMSMAHHVVTNRLRLTDEVAEIFYHCMGCGACTTACAHDNPVADVVVQARAHVVERTRYPDAVDGFRGDETPRSKAPTRGIRRRRWRGDGEVLLVRGHQDISEELEESLLGLCDRLEEGELGLGTATDMDLGVHLWMAGFHTDFLERARRVRRRLRHARHLVVLSAEALYVLREVYPRFGVRLDAEIVHVSDFLLPFIYGATLERVAGRIAYYEPCHLLRTPRQVASTREILRRVLIDAPTDLRAGTSELGCCGGGACAPTVIPGAAETAAASVVGAALEGGFDRLVVQAPECLGQLRAAAGDKLRVDDLITVCAEAVRGVA